MAYTPMQAYRAFDRIMAPKLRAEEYAASCDALFDAGEFSSSRDTMEDEHARVSHMVATRMGVQVADLHEGMCEALNKCLEACHAKGLHTPYGFL